jgi:alpha-L-rhamnosidase
MKAWISFMEKTSRNLVRPSTEYGDWLATDAVTPERAPTPCDLVGTAYFAASTRLVAETARVLGHVAEAKRYDALHQRVVRAFQGEFVTSSGRVVGDTQTGYLLALAFDLLAERHRPAAVLRLVELIERHGNRLATGFVGTPLLCPVLSRFGRTDVAYRLLLQRKYPSWLYPVLNGATTMWERWNSWTEKSGFGDVGMNSFNHYAYGAVGEWMYGAVGGINPEPITPGFEHFRLQPVPCTAIRHARAEFDSPRGKIFSAWKLEGRRWRWEVVVPANARATAVVPAARLQDVSVSIGGASVGARKLRGRADQQGASFELPAGRYTFVVTNPHVVAVTGA